MCSLYASTPMSLPETRYMLVISLRTCNHDNDDDHDGDDDASESELELE